MRAICCVVLAIYFAYISDKLVCQNCEYKYVVHRSCWLFSLSFAAFAIFACVSGV